MTRTKQEIREDLERLAQQFQGETTRYAAQPMPSHAPWRKRPSRSELAFAEELERIEQERAALETQLLTVDSST
ncbi:hypothetical protein [Pseudomonas sp. ANT_H12B]|uniref:hypothetical protein n=1 Tax=Pseudomonas sp. ANT_H12B TaxID=2597348 RepID=UPI0011EE7AA6|nr:hypothetical protein [Pseudomonas sp. ANT_H12B]KAA0973842.1 hypothetical protein FQ185_12770 [Pseudomonas sp. ANT_H12B]